MLMMKGMRVVYALHLALHNVALWQCHNGPSIGPASSCPNTTMSTTSTVDGTHPQLTSSATFVHTSESLRYTATHVFLPVKPPDKNNYTPENNHSLACAVSSAAHVYASYISGTSEEAHWRRIAKMLDNLHSLQLEHLDHDHVISQLQRMQTGGMLSDSLQICTDNL